MHSWCESVATRRRTLRHAVRPSGQHFLRSRVIAAELVEQAGIGDGDLVLEIGAGTGRLTEALASRGGRVLAVELDPELVARLSRTYSRNPRITVVEADAMAVRLPERPFRAFGNLPFGVTTQLLRRLLDDPTSPLARADVTSSTRSLASARPRGRPPCARCRGARGGSSSSPAACPRPASIRRPRWMRRCSPSLVVRPRSSSPAGGASSRT